MTAERDTTRVVRSWLRADEHESADRVLHAVLARLDTTPQRRPWWPARRFTNVQTYTRLAIVAAAALVIAVAGLQFLPGPLVGGRPTPGPTATPLPTPVATAPTMPLGRLQPGRYAWSTPHGRLAFDVPAGWAGDNPSGIAKAQDQPGEMGLLVWDFDGFTVRHVYVDACLPPGTLSPVEQTSDALVRALEAQGSIVAAVTDLTVAGAPTKRIDLTEPEGLDRATCRHGVEGPLQIWADAAVDNYFSLGPGHRGVAWVLDVDGGPLVLMAAVSGDAVAADVAELDAIVASMQME